MAPGRAITSSAPTKSGQNSSQTETSKETGVFWSTRSEELRPYCSCIHSSRLTIPRWVFITPLGRPVEPEV